MKFIVIIFAVLLMAYIGAMLIMRVGGFCEQYSSADYANDLQIKTWLETTGICPKFVEPQNRQSLTL